MCVLQKARDEYVSADEAAATAGAAGSSHVIKNGSVKLNPVGGVVTAEHLKFHVELDELKELMQLKDKEAIEMVSARYESVERLATKGLDSDLLMGIRGDEADVARRVELYGRNEIPPKASKSFLRLAFEACRDPTLVMLMICAVISIGLSFYHPSGDDGSNNHDYRLMDAKAEANLEWIEGAAIITAVLIVVFVTAFNDWRKERQFRGLQDRIESDNLTSVVRQGQLTQINVKDLCVGDICCIKYGDLIPADGLVVEASDLRIDEASLTGETDLVKKNTTSNIVILSGTHVMEGSGKFLVLAVGVNSQTGIIMELLGAAGGEENTKNDKEDAARVKKDSKKIYTSINNSNGDKKKNSRGEVEDEKRVTKKKKPVKKYAKKHLSVLQVKLGKLALQIGYCGISGAILTFIILVVRMCIEEFGIKKNPWSNNYIKYMISFLIQAITVIVVAVPEGLPLAVTLALAFAVRRMTKDNNLVRHLDACETMGSATTICSDKTGTLTTNRMTAVECWIDGQYFTSIPDRAKISDLSRELIYESISVNSNYTSRIEKPKQQGEMPKQIGNKTECGLLGLVTDLGGDYDTFRAEYPSEELVKVYTFNSARKMMTTVIRVKDKSTTTLTTNLRLHSKGASEIVLDKCGYWINSAGEREELSVEKKERIVREVIEPMASNGLRTICVAYRDFVNLTHEPDWDGDESSLVTGMTCICLVGIEDPVRPEVPDAIKKCQSGGVVVRMVTGDNINTATSIAIKCGIVKPGDDFLILESKEFNSRIKDENGEVKQELLDQVWPRLRVLARSSPQDKYILVNGIVESKLNPNREVVAVTGDGTNDGPALKRADVGFAMGIQGTDVAKEASDIILTDDNFSSIVKAMMWGRNVYDSIAKFLQFQLTANLAAGVFSVVCAGSIQAVPLKAVQMLWVNLVMDTLASLALATEPPSEDLLNRRPYGRNKPIISLVMLKNIIGHAVYQLIVLFVLVFFIDDMMQVDSMVQYEDLTLKAQPSVHFTIIFNAFIFMTLFNEFNARKIHDERNVFSGLSRNPYFIGIWLICLIGQILIVNFGGIVFAVEPLDLHQWMWCVFFGIGSLLWGQLLACVPKSVVKKLVHIVLFWRYRPKAESSVAKQETTTQQRGGGGSGDYFNEQDNNIDNIEQEKEQLDKSTAHWIRGASRIHDQLQVVETFRKSLDKPDSELEDEDNDDDEETQIQNSSTNVASKQLKTNVVVVA